MKNQILSLLFLLSISFTSFAQCTVLGTYPQPSAIAGNPNACAAGVVLTYSVTPIPSAANYFWSMPGGWTGTSNTNTITVTSGSASGLLSVFVTGSACGNSTSSILKVFGSKPSQPAPIAGSTTVKAGSVNLYAAGGGSSVANQTSNYTWALPSGWKGTSTSKSIIATAGTTGGMVSVIANNGCGSSIPAMLSVNVTGTPTLSIASNCSATTYCTLIASLVNGSGAYTWSLDGAVVGTSNENTWTATDAGVWSCSAAGVTSNTIKIGLCNQ